jgi:hypothetical protein
MVMVKKPKIYSTPQAAKLIGVHVVTLWNWLSDEKVKADGVPLTGGKMLWQWTDESIGAAKAFKATQKVGRPAKKKK